MDTLAVGTEITNMRQLVELPVSTLLVDIYGDSFRVGQLVEEFGVRKTIVIQDKYGYAESTIYAYEANLDVFFIAALTIVYLP